MLCCFNPCCSVDMTGSLLIERSEILKFLFQSLLFCGYDWKPTTSMFLSAFPEFQSLLFCGYDWKHIIVLFSYKNNGFQSLLFCGYDWKEAYIETVFNLNLVSILVVLWI